MKYYLCLLILLLPLAAHGQKRLKKAPPPPPPIVERTTYARPPHRIAYGQAKKKFPFSNANTILLISFTASAIVDPGIAWDGDSTNATRQVPPEKVDGSVDTFGHIEVREIKTLTEKDAEHLADMFYNLSCGNGPITQVGCYNPRNAIIFLNKENKVVAEMEICFECWGYELRPTEFHVGDMRRCKYDELQKLFARAGVYYGVDK